MKGKYITLWRKTGEQCLDWDFYVSFQDEELSQVIGNLKKQGVRQFSTYVLGELVEQHSSTPTEEPNHD